MNFIKDTETIRSAIYGTLVADASGVGLHWIYSQGKIASIVKANDGNAEFLEPDEANYQGVPSFFAHPHCNSGDSSNYGAYVYVLLRAISSLGFDAGSYIREFQEFFGVGGQYVGYADGPMRETIYNITRIGKEIEQNVMSSPSSLDKEKKVWAAHYISRYFFEFERECLKETIKTPLRLQEWDHNELEEAFRLVDEIGVMSEGIGPDDDQMPALSRSAVLAWLYDGIELDAIVERAVRITNNNDTAVAYSKFMARIMRDMYGARSQKDNLRSQLSNSVAAHLSVLPEPSRKLIESSLKYSQLDVRGVTKRYGAACNVDMAVPVVLHILLNTMSFREANRANILASGDNCGRAVMLGPIAGVMYGVGGDLGIPQDWIDKTTMIKRLKATEGGRLLLM